jgi:hypothetical protein
MGPAAGEVRRYDSSARMKFPLVNKDGGRYVCGRMILARSNLSMRGLCKA